MVSLTVSFGEYSWALQGKSRRLADSEWLNRPLL